MVDVQDSCGVILELTLQDKALSPVRTPLAICAPGLHSQSATQLSSAAFRSLSSRRLRSHRTTGLLSVASDLFRYCSSLHSLFVLGGWCYIFYSLGGLSTGQLWRVKASTAAPVP
jgi:hypothetical protein